MGIRDRHEGVLTQVEVEDELIRYGDLLEDATYEYAKILKAEADAELEYKRTYSLARLAEDNQGTDKDREARAILRCAPELEKRLITEAASKSHAKLLEYFQARIRSLQTMAANVRSQV